jgi:hypothetical protein
VLIMVENMREEILGRKAEGGQCCLNAGMLISLIIRWTRWGRFIYI